MGCVIKCSAVATGQTGEAIVNTFHYDSGIAAGPPDLSSLAAAFDTAVATALLAATTSNYKYVLSRVDVVAGDGVGSFAESVASAGVVGSLATPSAPYQTAIMIKKVTGLAKRWARGRIFLSPRPTGDFGVNGTIVGSPTAIPALIAAMLVNLTDSLGQTYIPVIWASALHGSTAITNVVMSGTSGVRRSRRGRVLS